MNAAVPLGAVLVGLDESAESARALTWAATEARRRHWPLHLMHVVHDSAWVYSTASTSHSPMRAVVRDALVMLGDWHPDLRVTWSQPGGDPATRLAAGAKTACVVAVGSRGRSAVGDAMFGSVTTRLFAHTRCPVAVLRAGTPVPGPDAPVLVGVGYDESFATVLGAAFEEADDREVGLVVVHSWQLDASTIVDGLELQGRPLHEAQKHEEALLARKIADLARRYPDVEVSTHAIQGGAAEALDRYSADAAVLLVGTRGRGEISGAVFGSVSQSVIRSARCPVLIVGDGQNSLTSTSDTDRDGAAS